MRQKTQEGDKVSRVRMRCCSSVRPALCCSAHFMRSSRSGLDGEYAKSVSRSRRCSSQLPRPEGARGRRDGGRAVGVEGGRGRKEVRSVSGDRRNGGGGARSSRDCCMDCCIHRIARTTPRSQHGIHTPLESLELGYLSISPDCRQRFWDDLCRVPPCRNPPLT